MVGRETQSSNSAYLVWKIRGVRQGRIPTGPRKATRAEATTFKVLPLRMESGVVDRLDEAWQRLGMSSRTSLIRVALRTYLADKGERDLADLIAPEA